TSAICACQAHGAFSRGLDVHVQLPGGFWCAGVGFQAAVARCLGGSLAFGAEVIAALLLQAAAGGGDTAVLRAGLGRREGGVLDALTLVDIRLRGLFGRGVYAHFTSHRILFAVGTIGVLVIGTAGDEAATDIDVGLFVSTNFSVYAFEFGNAALLSGREPLFAYLLSVASRCLELVGLAFRRWRDRLVQGLAQAAQLAGFGRRNANRSERASELEGGYGHM